MFNLFQSNNMHQLLEVFIQRAAPPGTSALQPQTVLVQSSGMGQWLKIRQAEKTGIAANIECILPANLIWRLYQVMLADLDLPLDSPYAIEKLTWQLMQCLDADIDAMPGDDHTQDPGSNPPAFADIQQFLSGSGDRQVRLHQLAEKIATLFDQYLIYRPDWIRRWDQGEMPADLVDNSVADWQSQLWRRLQQSSALTGQQHRATLHAALIERLESAVVLPAGLPPALAVFGLSSLPAMYMDTLRALALHIDVDLYFLNPCQHYWGDIVSGKDMARRSVRQLLAKEAPLEPDDYLTIGNPLLSSMGRQGREFLELLLEIDTLEAFDGFVRPQDGSMLQQVKADILELTFGGEFGVASVPTKRSVADSDLSIQIHVCHSALREVEVLHDQLLRLMEASPDIVPADVIVMMPDVGDYAPFIEAVFDRRELPFTIADRSLGGDSAVLTALTTLLSLGDQRLTSVEVLDLLEVPAVANRFALDEEDLLQISVWIRDAGIRWELDGETKAARWQLPPLDNNTWRFGLDRMLLGYAMESDAGMPGGILPLDIAGTDAELLGTLCQVIDLVAGYREAVQAARSASEWRTLVLDLIDDFFAPAPAEELEFATVRELLITLETETARTSYEAPLTSRMFSYWLTTQLNISQQTRGFISGGITFATLVPMRSIPHRIVCLIGMNDGAYPREDRPVTFDLMAAAGYKKGDRSKRFDDRYLFLEALLSADETFYISYQGRSIKDNKDRPPSVLVSEFTDYLDQVFDHTSQVVHPLQPFNPVYFQGSRGPFVTYRPNWFAGNADESPARPFLSKPLSDAGELDISSVEVLQQIYRHPARFFLRQRLGVYFGDEDTELLETESFEQDGLESFQLNHSALDHLLQGLDPASWYERTRASGSVMAGDLGQRHMDRALARARLVAEAVLAYQANAPAAEMFHGDLQLSDGARLTASAQLHGNHLLVYRAGKLRRRQWLDAWILHLFVNAGRSPVTSLLLNITDSSNERLETGNFAPLDSKLALRILEHLVNLAKPAATYPLPFLPETSYAYVKALDSSGDQATAREAALAEWSKERGGTEGTDRNYTRCFTFPDDFTEAFDALAIDVYKPLLMHWGKT